MLNPEMICGLFLSKTWKSSFFRSPTARPWASRTTTGTSTAFTLTEILAAEFGAGVSCGCCAAEYAGEMKAMQVREMAARRFILVYRNRRQLHSTGKRRGSINFLWLRKRFWVDSCARTDEHTYCYA